MERLKKLVEFSKAELNGILLLIVILAILLAAPKFYSVLVPEPVYRFDDFKKDIADFKASETERNLYRPPKWSKKTKAAARYFLFDPNTIGPDKWEMLGVKPYTAKVIRNFVGKGGRFYKAEDLKKIYSLTPSDYDKLQPYIRIGEGPDRKGNLLEIKRSVRGPKAVVEINAADSTLLETITGIGPAFARRIIKYRERMGGFFSKEQLKEVYGLDSVKFLQIEKEIIVDAGLVTKLNINTAAFEELRKLPYLSYKQLNALLKYRGQHGNYSEPRDLIGTGIIDEATIKRISPYLSF